MTSTLMMENNELKKKINNIEEKNLQLSQMIKDKNSM